MYLTLVRFVRWLYGGVRARINRWGATLLAKCLPELSAITLVGEIFDRNPMRVTNPVGVRLNRDPDLDNMKIDLPLEPANLQLEHFAGLFASNNLNHGVIGLTFRMAAYTFGLIRQMNVHKIIEVGRYKGGSTLLMAAAMAQQGELWSIDIGEKEDRLHQEGNRRPFDEQLRDLCSQLKLNVHLVVGDSRTIEVETGQVDLVFIDGEHTYEAVLNDYERFGRRLRVGGALIFDDVSAEGTFSGKQEYMEPIIKQILESGDFKLVKTVDRLGHFERIR